MEEDGGTRLTANGAHIKRFAKSLLRRDLQPDEVGAIAQVCGIVDEAEGSYGFPTGPRVNALLEAINPQLVSKWKKFLDPANSWKHTEDQRDCLDTSPLYLIPHMNKVQAEGRLKRLHMTFDQDQVLICP